MIQFDGPFGEHDGLLDLLRGIVLLGWILLLHDKDWNPWDPTAPLFASDEKRMIEILPLLQTGVLSLCVSLPIFGIRQMEWVSSATSRKLLHICFS